MVPGIRRIGFRESPATPAVQLTAARSLLAGTLSRGPGRLSGAYVPCAAEAACPDRAIAATVSAAANARMIPPCRSCIGGESTHGGESPHSPSAQPSLRRSEPPNSTPSRAMIA